MFKFKLEFMGLWNLHLEWFIKVYGTVGWKQNIRHWGIFMAWWKNVQRRMEGRQTTLAQYSVQTNIGLGILNI